MTPRILRTADDIRDVYAEATEGYAVEVPVGDGEVVPINAKARKAANG